MAFFSSFALLFTMIFGIGSVGSLSPRTAARISAPTENGVSVDSVKAATNNEADSTEDSQSIEKLAKCLTTKGVIMYGAYWCPHCQKQKALFGSNFKYIKYQECDAAGENGNPQACEKAGIKGYPTWIIPGQENLEGSQTIEELQTLSGCNK